MAAAKGLTFAGKYTIVETSCGASCVYIAVINEETGEIATKMPFYALITDPFHDERGREVQGGLFYRLNSRLLIAEGCFDTTGGDTPGYCAKAYYEWAGNGF